MNPIEQLVLSHSDQQFLRLLGDKFLAAERNDEIRDIHLTTTGYFTCRYFTRGLDVIEECDPRRAEAIVRTIASSNGLACNDDHPIVSTEFPLRRHRIELNFGVGGLPPSFAMRKRIIQDVRFESLLNEYRTLTVDQANWIRKAVVARTPIVFAGGPGHGKTTLFSGTLDLYGDLAARLIYIEDVRELKIVTPHTEILLAGYTKTNKYVSEIDLLRSLVRHDGDRGVFGEIRTGASALEYLKLDNVGMPGGAASIHATEARSVPWRLHELLGEIGARPSQERIARTLSTIVFLENYKVVEIVRATGWNGTSYEFEKVA